MSLTQKIQGYDVVFFRIPVCGKCKAAALSLKSLGEERPELKILELNLLSNIGLARSLGLLTAPALLVKGKPLRGPVTKEEIRDALDSGQK